MKGVGMGLLNAEERQKLIELLCQLPGIEDFTVRFSLTATHGMRNEITTRNNSG
jgi:hypothetical protein